MTWSDVYLICFIVGFALSLISFLLGAFHFHLPHVHLHGHLHLHAGHAVGHVGSGHVTTEQISLFNFGSVCAFLAWFGGTGFLLSQYYSLWTWLTLFIATIAGLVGALIVFWF